MKTSLSPGSTFRRQIKVDKERTIDFLGEAARVYATPALVRDVEVTCREGLLEHLEPGEDSVGARIELDHLAPTLLDMTVDITATVAEIKGRLVTFEIAASDAVEEIARGRHVRFVVESAKTVDRLAKKAARAAAAQAKA